MPAVTPLPSLARQIAVARLRVQDLARRLAAAARAGRFGERPWIEEYLAAARRALERLEVLEAEERRRQSGLRRREEVDRANH